MIALGADHGGYFLKEEIKKHLRPADRYTSPIYTLAAIKGETEKA